MIFYLSCRSKNLQFEISTFFAGQVTLYHYTNATGADGIAEKEVIKGSTEKTPEKNRRHGCGKSPVC